MGKYDPVGVFVVEPFNIQVPVFKSVKRLQNYHVKTLGENPIKSVPKSSTGLCIGERGKDGGMWYYIFIGKNANAYTVAHECSHLVDMIMHDTGVPISMENTEIRAYLLAYCCEMVDRVLGGEEK